MEFHLIDYLNQIVALWPQFAQLGVVTLFIPAVINALKGFGLIADDNAGLAFGIIEAILFVGFVVVKLFGLEPGVDIGVIDKLLVAVANVLTTLLGFLGTLGIGRAAYKAVWRKLKGIFGFSYSQNLPYHV